MTFGHNPCKRGYGDEHCREKIHPVSEGSRTDEEVVVQRLMGGGDGFKGRMQLWTHSPSFFNHLLVVTLFHPSLPSQNLKGRSSTTSPLQRRAGNYCTVWHMTKEIR